MSDGERVRLFVALDLPAEVRAAVHRWAAAVAQEPAPEPGAVHRWAAAVAQEPAPEPGPERPGAKPRLRVVRAESLHVTLCFLGACAAGDAPAIARACEEPVTRGDGVDVALGEPRWLPPGNPRVLAVGLRDDAGALAGLQSRLSIALHAGGWHVPERRPFTPHITVARVARGARATRADGRRRGAAEIALPRVSPGDARPASTAGGGCVRGETVTLYRSVTEPGGARYEALATLALAPGPS